MPRPISVRTIGADDTDEGRPAIQDHTLTLKFRLQSWGELDKAKLAKMLHCVLRDYSDGRYPFNAEMITSGLARCLERAVLHTIEEETQKEFGHEVVPHADGRGNTSKWYIEANKRFAEGQHPWVNSEPEVEIT